MRTSRSSFQGMSASGWGFVAPFTDVACFFNGGADSLFSQPAGLFRSSIFARPDSEDETGVVWTPGISGCRNEWRLMVIENYQQESKQTKIALTPATNSQGSKWWIGEAIGNQDKPQSRREIFDWSAPPLAPYHVTDPLFEWANLPSNCNNYKYAISRNVKNIWIRYMLAMSATSWR